MYFRALLIVLFGFAESGSTFAKAPSAPSNLRVTPLGVNSFLLKWNDNSKNEVGWEILIAEGMTKHPKRFQLIPFADITSYVLLTTPATGKTLSFQLAAYNGKSGAEVFSKKTSVVVTKAFDKETFAPPVALVATPLDDGRVRLAWNDMSTSEHGYQIEAKKGFENWAPVAVADPDVKSSIDVRNFEPGTRYTFRVRGFKTYPLVFTKYSNIASADTLTFQAPDSLTATPGADGSVSLKWKDRSSLEAGYEIEAKSGTAAFSKIGEVGMDISSTDPIKNFALNTDYQFRVRAVRFVNFSRIYSGYSSVASAKTLLLSQPKNLMATVVSNTSARLSWTDASARENLFVIQRRRVGTTEYTIAGSVGENVNEYLVTGLVPGASYEFRVGSSEFSGTPAYSTPVSVKTTGGSLDPGGSPPIFWNTSFTYKIRVTDASALQSMEVTGLPLGLTYDSNTLTITGTTMEEGVRTIGLKATFQGSPESTDTLVLRIVRPPAPPVATGSFAPLNVTTGITTQVSTTGRFSDPDTLDVRRITTTLGDIDLILYSAATPATVTNFINYVNTGRYNGSFFHRSPENFVVQGGGYRSDGSVFTEVSKYSAILNEPGISNSEGTVAMAKTAGNPNSATSEFFFNVTDNSTVLDSQNGGFTVFGRVAGTGLNIVEAINALPRKAYTINVGGTSKILDDVPVNIVPPAPEIMDPSKLVRVTSITAIPILRYEVLSSDTAVATAVVNGLNIDITGIASGSATLTVKAIDVDGQVTSQTFTVKVL